MNPSTSFQNKLSTSVLMKQTHEYFTDTFQRSVLYMDAIRKRGNIYFQHIAEGHPPVLTFEYKTIMEGKNLKRPVNYSLVQILGRRKSKDRRKKTASGNNRKARRQIEFEKQDQHHDPQKRPIIIIDPRAGHGPGIGGSKRDSEIGMAIAHGHPVYFIIFSTNPEPGQTLADVQNANIRFIEEVADRHPDAGKPAIIGNCQGGWASALIGAQRPDLAGPMVFNGSPLSYWAGVEGNYPMRYKGGLVGGAWTASFLSDLGCGKFDGANLVAGFEDLNPANTHWKKQYNLYANIDTEEQRYLDFERWWNGFFYMTTEEIHFIVANLFVGNQLEKGLLELDEKTTIDLRNTKEPILVFASGGDNITPPQQALNWIYRVWGGVEKIMQDQRVIVYLLHDTIGHLGIFVSGKVSRKEHHEIIGSIDLIGYLSPGLYEMVIFQEDDSPKEGDYEVRFEKRDMNDILALDDGLVDENDFYAVSEISKNFDQAYQQYARPWVQMFSNELTAEYLRQMHPLRWTKYCFSDLTPALFPIQLMAPYIKKQRKPAPPENFFLAMEKTLSDGIASALDTFRDLRDQSGELLFRTIYGNPWVQFFYDNATPQDSLTEKEKQKMLTREDTKEWIGLMEAGGFIEGILRIMVAMAGVDQIFDRQELKFIRKLIRIHNILTKTNEHDLKNGLQEQARILQTNKTRAIKALPKLIRGPENRLVAIQIADSIANADFQINKQEKKLLDQIKRLLDDKKTL